LAVFAFWRGTFDCTQRREGRKGEFFCDGLSDWRRFRLGVGLLIAREGAKGAKGISSATACLIGGVFVLAWSF
jgi:hypothetical protein